MPANTKHDEQDFLTVLSGVFGLIKESWEAFLRNLLTFVLLFALPVMAIILVVIIIVGIVTFSMGGGAGFSRASIIYIASLLLLVLAISVSFLPAVTITQLASVRKKKINPIQAFIKGLPFVFKYLLLGLLVVFSVLAGFILLVIPGMLLGFFFSMSFYILIDKKVGVFEALKHSFNLVKQNWMLVLCLYIVNMAISAVNYLPFVGWAISLGLSIAYFCLPALIYVKIAKK